MDYINKGTCIFCGKDVTQTTFKEKPHTMPKSLGSINIGVDICDECNHYFGQPDDFVFPKRMFFQTMAKVVKFRFIVNKKRKL